MEWPGDERLLVCRRLKPQAEIRVDAMSASRQQVAVRADAEGRPVDLPPVAPTRKGPRSIKLPNGDVRIRRSEYERWLAERKDAA